MSVRPVIYSFRLVDRGCYRFYRWPMDSMVTGPFSSAPHSFSVLSAKKLSSLSLSLFLSRRFRYRMKVAAFSTLRAITNRVLDPEAKKRCFCSMKAAIASHAIITYRRDSIAFALSGEISRAKFVVPRYRSCAIENQPPILATVVLRFATVVNLPA